MSDAIPLRIGPRVLIVGLHWPPEPFIGRTLARLAVHGVRVTVAMNRAAPRRDSVPQGVQFLSGSRLREADVDLVHFQWNSAAIDHLNSPLLWSRPVIISCRGSQLRIRPHVTPRYLERLRETFERATAVHCVCDAIREEAIALGLAPGKAEVIYPAVDTAEFTPTPQRERSERLHLLAVGAITWTKGYEYALLALRKLLDDGIPTNLEIIGAGDEQQRLAFTIEDLGLRAAVTTRGSIQPAGVREAMRRADVLLHSSLSEGISNAVLEAMACGVPVVTSNCGGMREAVTHGVDGFIVPVRDALAAASAVKRLAQDPELRLRIGRAGRIKVERQFRLDEQVERFAALYERVALGRVEA